MWQSHERSGLGKIDTRDENKPSPGTNLIERSISVPVDPNNASDETFDLYYFVRMPPEGRALKTVLYCAGGPGQIVQGPTSGVTPADFLTDNGYNVVYFHQRGAGFSQIPASNQHDKFLKTSNAIEDIEAIRRHFLGEHGKWEAIIGWSYGTVIAQQYAHFYPDNVERLILLGPLSRDKFKNSAKAFEDVLHKVRSIERDTLERIYSLPQFEDLSLIQKNFILETIFGSTKKKGVFDRVDEAFGSIEFVIESYCDLRSKNELTNYNLDNYSRQFFRELRNIRMFGWHPKEEFSTDDQMRIGHRIKEEVLHSHKLMEDCTVVKGHDSPGFSNRAHYVIRTYDGINMRFLKEWFKNDKKHVLDALKKSGGEAHDLRNVNEYIEKVGIKDDETIEPWDPAQYKHDRPTLILKGSADTVPAKDAAEYYFRDALTGDRTFIEFLGIGHALLSDTIIFPENILSGTVRIDQLSMAAGESRQVSGIYRGLSLNENFRIDLKTNDLQSNLKLVGFGIAGKNQLGSLDVIALIENTGIQSVTIPTRWILNNKSFGATVSFNSQIISPGTKEEVRGRIEGAWGHSAVRIDKPHDLEPSLDYVCAHVRRNPDDPLRSTFLEIWIQNNSRDSAADPVDGGPKSWTVSTAEVSSTFNVDPNPLASQEVLIKEFLVELPFLTDLNLQEETKIRLSPQKSLLGCIQEQTEGKFSMAIYNPEPTVVPPGPHTLTIDNPVFTETFDIDLPEIKSLRAVIIQPTNPKYNWKNIPVLHRLSNVDAELELRGWYLTRESEVSMLLRKNGQNGLDGAAAEWVYIDPKDQSGACKKHDMSRNCLIFSFLLMSSKAFKNPIDNKVLGIIKDNQATICYRGQDGSYEKITDKCP
jgi:pimeloyl-ACP methyl ester carboxylesterase